MPKKLMAANWKMFKTWEEARQTARELVVAVRNDLPADREVLICPPFTALRGVSEMLMQQEGFYLGGQNFYPGEQGAFTGEISPDQLLDAGCSYALVGHSERRHVLGEKDDFLAMKVAFGLQKGLKVILCVGETLEERKQGQVQAVLHRQLEQGLKSVSAGTTAENLAVAYEPVWAIGTGETAVPPEIQEAHDLVREKLKNILKQGETIRILYGGSVKPENTASIISLDNVEGVLVGGASLNADKFSQIILA
ncbi:triose-phosphate isomerase [Desulfonatronospira sp.]|uniref:triose-phosphate isomerase n=1 Tax=Desulfonatronospira sp. TaxID=1962951 RepID=UPI0025BE713A|nr:triose-phosphate isomerase [Desulfonatronospira sp.]